MDLLDPTNYAFMAANVAAFLLVCAAVWWFCAHSSAARSRRVVTSHRVVRDDRAS